MYLKYLEALWSHRSFPPMDYWLRCLSFRAPLVERTAPLALATFASACRRAFGLRMAKGVCLSIVILVSNSFLLLLVRHLLLEAMPFAPSSFLYCDSGFSCLLLSFTDRLGRSGPSESSSHGAHGLKDFRGLNGLNGD